VRQPRRVALAAALLVAAASAQVRANPGAEDRSGVPRDLDLGRLVGKPRQIGMDYRVWRDPETNEKRLGGFVDIVAVYDIPIEYLMDATVDFESYPSFVPYIHEAKVLSRADSAYRIQYHSGIKFLGISVTYDSVFEAVVTRDPDGGVKVGSRLVESLDDAEYEHYTSTYLLPVEVDGKTMTFVRYYNSPGIKRPSPGMLQVPNLFATREGKRQVEAFAEEAARRAGSPR